MAVTGMPTVVLLAIWEGKEDKRRTSVGFQHGALLSSILPGLCHSPGRYRRELRETAIPDKEGKDACGHELSPFCPLHVQQAMADTGTGGMASHCLDRPGQPNDPGKGRCSV